MGVFFVVTAVLISSYYSVIADWTLRYVLDVAWSGIPADAGTMFNEAASGPTAFAYTACI
jgi:SNF family Na+-dependent transporter